MSQPAKSARGGRPRKLAGEKRSERLSGVSLTTAERAQIEAKAALAGLSVAEFARRAILGIRITPQASALEERALRELNRIGVNLAQLLKAAHYFEPVTERDIKATLAQVRAALENLVHGS